MYIEQAKFQLYRQAPYWSHILQVTDVEEVAEVPPELLAQHPELAGKGVYTVARKDHWCVVFVESVVQDWPQGQRVGALAAELMRIVTRSASRRGDRLEAAHWTAATDLVVNVALHESGYVLPDEALFPKDVSLSEGLNMETYYDALIHKFPPQPQQQGSGGGSGTPPPGQSGGQIGEPLDSDGERRVNRASRAFAKSVDRTQGVGALAEDLPEETFEDSVTDWRDILYQTIRNAITEQAGSDYARYGKLSARQGGVGYGAGCPRLPSWYKRQYDLAVALDTSGSMYGDLGRLRAEVEAICSAVGAEVRLIQCDAAVAADGKHRKGQALALKGGGGTSFVPVFDAVAAGPKKPTALVYLTDGYGEFPSDPPGYPVIWAKVGSIGDDAFPFGKVVAVGGS